MTSTLEKSEGLSRVLAIQVPEEKVRQAFEKVYKEIQKNATIKGFRPGKAPITSIRTMYAERVKPDVLQELISESYQDAVTEHSLDPIGQPRVQFDAFVEDSPFEYKAELEIRPEVHLVKYEGLKAEPETYTVDDAQIEQILTNMQQAHADTVPVFEDRGAQMGDVVELDFEGKLGTQPLPGGSAKDYTLELGTGNAIPGFEDGILGMKVGSHRDVHVTFPADYHAKDVAGQPATFHMHLKSLKKKVPAELNDEFPKKVGLDGTMEQLRKRIREDIVQGEERRIQEDLKGKILKALVAENPVEVPQSLLQQQKAILHEDVKQRMQQQAGAAFNEKEFEEYKVKWDSDFEQTATYMVQSSFLVDALADKLNLRPNDEDVNKRLEEQAKMSGIELERIKEFYSDREHLARLLFQIAEEKVVNYLLEKKA